LSAYKRFGGEAAYLRQKGPEPQQQEAMILEYIGKNNRITRSKAAELCQLGPFQAKRILKKLVNDGKITQKGAKRGAYYELAP